MPLLPYHVPKTLKHLNVTSALTSVQELLPPLNGNLKKGECGRIGVVGGSLVYAGAPYFSAITALKVGCDMVHVFCPADAANVIKGYSPELMVHPSYDKDTIAESLYRIDAFVLGPGLGREEKTLSVVEFDGLFLLAKNLDIIQGYEQAILTPNHSEFSRLYQSAFKIDKIDRGKLILVRQHGNWLIILVVQYFKRASRYNY
ncbi:ATP-dependent (S)-NAD(P)H-hydrate dehydratase [Dirofilaria immitis]|nr:ATP-dependent (S)-NAD(P)H-hydrate dehydratase [Dirofilaria immitis]